jgi:hypothetical protein
MPNFNLKKITAIRGKQVFYQLTIDDDPIFSPNDDEVAKNEKRTGVLDIYERDLEAKHSNDLEKIYAYMNMVADNKHVPGTKYHELERNKNDPYPDFEFKHGDLRVYGVKISGGKIIVLGGFKNEQRQNITRLRSLKKQYFESISKGKK